MNRRSLLESAGATVALAGTGLASVPGDCCCGSDCDWEDCCPLCADCGQQVQ